MIANRSIRLRQFSAGEVADGCQSRFFLAILGVLQPDIHSKAIVEHVSPGRLNWSRCNEKSRLFSPLLFGEPVAVAMAQDNGRIRRRGTLRKRFVDCVGVLDVSSRVRSRFSLRSVSRRSHRSRLIASNLWHQGVEPEGQDRSLFTVDRGRVGVHQTGSTTSELHSREIEKRSLKHLRCSSVDGEEVNALDHRSHLPGD